MNQQNNNSRRPDVTLNTNIGNYFSQQGRLRVGIWNDRLTIEFAPRVVGGSGAQMFSTDNTTKITMTRPEALTILESVKAMENEHMPSVLIPLGYGDSKKLVEIGKDEATNSYIKLFNNKLATGDVDTSRCAEFKFNKHSFSDGVVETPIDSEFKDFMIRVKEYSEHTGADYHAGKYSEMIRAHYAKSYSGGGNSNYKNNSYGNNNYNNNYGTAQIEYKGTNLDFIPNDGDLPF